MIRRTVGVVLMLMLVSSAFAQFRPSSLGEIVRAEYGARDRRVDVTDRVRSLIQNNTLNFRVGTAVLGIDPAPGAVKTLRLRIRDAQGLIETLTFQDNAFVQIRVSGGAGQPTNSLYIHRAQYGWGNRMADVTSRLNSQIQNGRLNIPVTNETMGGDPAVGKDKVLSVDYTLDGQRKQVSVNEGGYLNLVSTNPQPTYNDRNLWINRAQYGWGNRIADVTSRLNSQIQNGRLNIPVTNETMGGDPAVGKDKVLSVDYTVDGQQKQVRINEGGYLNLASSNPQQPYYRQGLWINRAQYGWGNRMADVTSRLNSQIQNGRLNIPVTNESMGGDPAVGKDKVLSVDYTVDGQQKHVSVNEGGYLNVASSNPQQPYNRGGLWINRAQYGWGNRMADVTSRLNSQIQNGRLNIPVTNESMGGDPAVGKDKVLTVDYTADGQQKRVSVNEGGYLNVSSSSTSTGFPNGRYLSLPTGTQLRVRTNETIDSRNAAAGQRYSAMMYEDVTDSYGSVVIPKGANVDLVIRDSANSGLVLDMDSVIIAGQRYYVSTGDLQQNGRDGIGANRRTAAMVGGGAAIGALIGAIAGGGKGAAIGAGVGAAAGAGTQVLTQGKEVRVPAETVLTFRLDQDLNMQAGR